MQNSLALFNTTVGKKALVAVTGLILFGFVLQHMIGNLRVFLGQESYNAYAASLKEMPGLIWTARLILLVALIVHTVLVIDLYRQSLVARPVGYRQKKNVATTYAASAMKYTGPALFLYIIFHVAHFTYPGMKLGDADFNPADVYTNFVSSFRVPWVTALYVVANLLLGMHLYHGAWSMFQSVGLSHPRYDAWRQRISIGLALLITAGNVIMPLAVLVGIIG